jgi:5-methylcytosine-specific restriction endonuclease McrA
MSLEVNPNDGQFATFDHVVPLHDGGRRSSAMNIRLAHRSCNMRRGYETGQRRKKEATCAILANRADR